MGQGEGGGRPIIELSQEQRIQIEALAAYLTQTQIADYLGISQDTFQRIIIRDEETGIRYRRGKATAIGAIAQNLVNKAQAGDFNSQRFYLMTQAGWNETVKQEHYSPDGSMTPKGDGPVAIYALPDNGRDKPNPASKRKTPRRRKPKASAKPKAKRTPRAARKTTAKRATPENKKG